MLNAANDRFFNFQWYVGRPATRATAQTEVALKPAELAAAQTDPNVFPTPVDSQRRRGRPGLDPDRHRGRLPAGPGGRRRAAADHLDHRPDPVRRRATSTSTRCSLAPAERADVIVDFSKFAGKTLILYNDAPAAFPARVADYDYYTGAPDLSPVGAPDDPARLRAEHPHRHAGDGRAPHPGAGVQPGQAAGRVHSTTPTAPACSSPASTRSSSGRPPTTRPTARASRRAATATRPAAP